MKIFNCVLQEPLKEIITVLHRTRGNKSMHALLSVLDISGSQYCVQVVIQTQVMANIIF
jgi:hypothetical protein